MYLKSYDFWIENKMIIEYVYGGKTYAKQIERESSKEPYKVGQILYITINKELPDKVLEIADEKDDSVLLYIGVVAGLLLMIVIVALLLSH